MREFADLTFKELDMELEWVGEGIEEKGVCRKTGKTYVGVEERYYRPTAVDMLIGDASKAKKELGWDRKRNSRSW